ncbi:MAG: hypothetical protein E5W57_21745, partial [Mesorhizobium sp.]
ADRPRHTWRGAGPPRRPARRPRCRPRRPRSRLPACAPRSRCRRRVGAPCAVRSDRQPPASRDRAGQPARRRAPRRRHRGGADR